MEKTTKQMREDANLTLEQAAERIHAIEPSAPQTKVGLWHIENNGTDRLRIIEAMAIVYCETREAVERANMRLVTKNVINA